MSLRRSLLPGRNWGSQKSVQSKRYCMMTLNPLLESHVVFHRNKPILAQPSDL